MSWILGALGPLDKALQGKIEQIIPRSLFQFNDQKLFLRAGGIEETCNHGTDREITWAVCGLGIDRKNGDYHFVSNRGWRDRLAVGLDPRNLDGQFAGVSYKNGSLQLFTDTIGSRDLYYTKYHDVLLFSTRIDWLAKLSGNSEIDLEEFSARWLFFYQLSTDSILKNITRLGSGAYVTVIHGLVKTDTKAWLPKNTDLRFDNTLDNLTTFASKEGKKITLGLSGGLDSRLLFSLLLHKDIHWDVHTFGPEDHPDAIVAKQIAKAFGVSHRHFHSEPLKDKDLENKLQEYCAQSLALRPASSILQLQHYSQLYEKDVVVIDGSFGEIARRQMLNRIALRGKTALLKRQADQIFPHLSRFRADFFSDEVNVTLRESAIKQIEDLWEELPDPNVIGTGNWLDLVVVRCGLPNVNAAEQARIDHYVAGYMPFVQPSLLNTIFKIPASDRRGGRIFRNLIRKNENILRQFPLVAVNCTVPYSFTTIPAYALRKAKAKLNRTYNGSNLTPFLTHLRPLIEDLAASSSDQLIDKKKLRHLINNYYKGDTSLESQVDWWLGFRLWTSSLN
jgi:hypothetical protein